MLDVADRLQTKYDEWFEEVESWSGEEVVIDEHKAFELFWARMSPEDAAEALKYKD